MVNEIYQTGHCKQKGNIITRSPCTRSSAYSRFPRLSISMSRVQKMASLDVQVATKHASVCPN